MTGKIFAGFVLGGLLTWTPLTALANDDSEIALQPGQSLATEVDIVLKGYVFGIRLVRVDFKSHFTDKDFFAFANFRTSGLGALLKKQKI